MACQILEHRTLAPWGQKDHDVPRHQDRVKRAREVDRFQVGHLPAHPWRFALPDGQHRRVEVHTHDIEPTPRQLPRDPPRPAARVQHRRQRVPPEEVRLPVDILARRLPPLIRRVVRLAIVRLRQPWVCRSLCHLGSVTRAPVLKSPRYFDRNVSFS